MAAFVRRLALLWCLSLFFIGMVTPAIADDHPVRITSQSVANDPSGELAPGHPNFEELDFRSLPSGRQSLGASTTPFWLKLQVSNPTEEHVVRWLEVGQARLRQVNLYDRHQGLWRVRNNGTAYPFSEREIGTLTPVFSVELPPGSTETLWVRVASPTIIVVHPTLWTTPELLAVERHNTQLEFFTAGAVTLMLLFGLAAYVLLREPGYFIFGLTGLCFLLFRWSIKGIAFREIWPNATEWAQQSIGVFLSILAILTLALHRTLLRTPKHFPQIDRVIRVMMASFGFFALAFLTEFPHESLMRLFTLWGLTISLSGPILGYMAWRRGEPLGGYALAGYVLPWQALQLLYFSSIGWLPALPRAFTQYAMTGSILVASLVILAGLGARTAQLYRDAQSDREQKHRELEALVDSRTRELADAKQTAEQALADHRQFIATASHELRSPVAAISSACEVLKVQSEQNPDVAFDKILARIQRAVRRTRWFLDNLIAEDRFESGSWQPQLRPVDPTILLSSVIQHFRQTTPQCNVSLLTEALPERVNLDADMIHIMLTNLIENANKYSPKGSPVNVVASMEHENLIIEVLDHGPGVPRDDRAVIFNKYTRGGQADEAPGTGMGLYIVKRVVAKHSGEVALYDRPMGGTCVHITLPLLQEVCAG